METSRMLKTGHKTASSASGPSKYRFTQMSIMCLCPVQLSPAFSLFPK